MRFITPRLLPLLACLLLSGCGFHLRGSEGDTSFAQKFYVEGAVGTFLGAFNAAVTGTGGAIVGNAAESSAVIRLYRASYQRQPITLNRTGRATAFDLSYRIVYELRGPKGEILQARKEFEIKRDYFNDQSLPLAQLAEEGQIREELEKDAAQSLLRRVVTLLKRTRESGAAAETPS